MTRLQSARSLRPLCLIALVGVLLAPGALAAQSTAKAPAPKLLWIGDLDANHDGKITPAEAAAMPVIAKNFAAIDANHDGAITMSEVKAMWRREWMGAARNGVQGRMAAFAKSDANHDGKLTAAEAQAAGMKVVSANFQAIDANHDGSIDQQEMHKAAVALAERALTQRGRRIAALFAKADADHDGKLSRAEFTAAFPRFAPAFAFFDENHDGAVELAEFALPPRF